MRTLVKSLVIIALLLPTAGPLRASAQGAWGPCAFAVNEAELPPEMEPDSDGGPRLNLSDDPLICELLFRAPRNAPNGLTEVRSLVIVSPSLQQAEADFAEYRALLIQNGWNEVGPQPVGDEATVFTGADRRAGIYSVHHLFRRGYIVATIEATGPLLASNPEVILDLARSVDYRVAREVGTTSLGSTLRGVSVWPSVSVPTVVRDNRVTGAPLVGQAIELGGFSGLVSLDAEGTKFVAVTDRGPDQPIASGPNRILTFPLPAYTPSIVKLELKNNELRVAERIGLRLAEGYVNPRTGTPYVTGLPIRETDPAVYDQTGRNRWGIDAYGVDPEGIAIDPRDGSYWIAEEYGPSILHVAADGTILTRLVPEGVALYAPGENPIALLPAELGSRRADRGFEGIAISPDGGWLFVAMESALPVPNTYPSRNIRIISINLQSEQPLVDGMFVYQAEPYNEVGAGHQDDVKIGDLTALSGDKLLLVEEDTTPGGTYKMLYRIDLAEATNLIDWPDRVTTALELADDFALADLNIQPLPKTPIVNLGDLGWADNTIEGLAPIDGSTLAVAADNNFGFGGYDSAGRLLSNGLPSRVSIVKLPRSLRD